MEIKPVDISHSEEVTQVFNDAFAGEYIIEERLIRQNIFRDKNFHPEGCFGAWEGDKLLGFICCKYLKVPAGSDGLMPDTGWISCLAVRKEHQAQGIGSNLLERGEAFLKSHNRSRIVLSGDYLRIFGGVPDIPDSVDFFTKRGYQLGRQYYDLINTDDIITSGYSANYDFEYREMREDDIASTKDFFARCFPGKWGHMAVDYIDNHPDMLRDIFLALDKGKVIGFVRLYDKNSVFIGPSLHWRLQVGPDCGGIGPAGVDEEYRGKNAGITLLKESLITLKKRGAWPLVIDCTHFLDFYARLGFKPWKKYHSAEKKV